MRVGISDCQFSLLPLAMCSLGFTGSIAFSVKVKWVHPPLSFYLIYELRASTCVFLCRKDTPHSADFTTYLKPWGKEALSYDLQIQEKQKRKYYTMHCSTQSIAAV